MLKRAALLVCTLLVTLLPAYAQELPEEERLRSFHVGVSAGLNYIDIRNPFDFPDPEIDHVFYSAPSVGVLAGYNFDETFGIRVGLFYTGMGRKAKETINFETRIVDIEKTVDLDYIQIPILLHLHTQTTFAEFYAQFGLVYSLLQGTTVVRNDVEQDTETLFRDTQFGGLFEFGPIFPLSDTIFLSVGLRGYVADTDLNHEDLDTEGFLVGKSRNVSAGLHLTLIYTIPVGR